jgi:hypothetical protein
MNLLSDPAIFNQLFGTRNRHLQLLIGATDASSGSRIGGRAPECLARTPLTCPCCSRPMNYYLTLAPDVLGSIIEDGRALSIFYCPDYPCRLRNRSVQSQPSVLVIDHIDCARGADNQVMDSPMEGRSLLSGQVIEDLTEYGEEDQGSKIGGRPGLLQDTGDAELKKLEAEGLNFLFQFNEDSYPKDMAFKEYTFGFGLVYVFCRFDMERRMADIHTTAAFWQTT